MLNRVWSDHRHHFWQSLWDEMDDIETSGDSLVNIEYNMMQRDWELRSPVSLLRRQPDGMEYWVDCNLR